MEKGCHKGQELTMSELRRKCINDSNAIEIIDKEQWEVDLSKKYHQWYGSAFFVIQKLVA